MAKQSFEDRRSQAGAWEREPKTTVLVNYDNDSTVSYVSLGNELALADADWSNAAASASADWSLADDNAAITALNGLNAAQGLPWTQFLADKAVAERDCTLQQQPNDLLYAANVNNEYVSFQAAAGAEMTLLVSNLGTATVSWTTDVATAAQTRITQTADAAQAAKLGQAPLAEAYQNALAQAERDNRVATAQANRDYAASNDYEAYTEALGTASVDYQAARSSAVSDYRTAAAPLAAARVQDVAQANHDYVNARALEDQQFATSTAQHERTYAVNVASAYETMRVNVATFDANAQTQQSQAKESASVAMETSQPSPWATFAKSDATAKKQQTAASTSADVQLATAVASAAQDETEQLATADETQATDEATNYRQYAEQMSAADLTLAIDEAQAILNSTGTTLEPPSDPPPATHTGREVEDYNNYDGPPQTTDTVALNDIGTNLSSDPGLASTNGSSTPDNGQNTPDTYDDTEEHLDDFHTYAYDDYYTLSADDANVEPFKELPIFPTDQGPTEDYRLIPTPIPRDTAPAFPMPPPDDFVSYLESIYPWFERQTTPIVVSEISGQDLLEFGQSPTGNAFGDLVISTTVPGAGEVMDAAVLADPNTPLWGKALVVVSVGVNIFLAGYGPNAGPIVRAVTDSADDVLESTVRASDEMLEATEEVTEIIFKAPQPGKGQKQLTEGFLPEDFAEGDMRAYFAKQRELAEEYAEKYGDGVLEVEIPKDVYDLRIKQYEVPYLSDPRLTEIPIPHGEYDVLNDARRRLHGR